MEPAGRPRDRGEVLDGGEDLDRGDGGGLEIGEPAEGRSGQAAKCVVGEAAGPTTDVEDAAQLGVDESEEDDDGRGDDPGEDNGGAGENGRGQGPEQPSGTDDRSLLGPHQAKEAHIALQTLVNFAPRGTSGLGDGCHCLSPRVAPVLRTGVDSPTSTAVAMTDYLA